MKQLTPGRYACVFAVALIAMTSCFAQSSSRDSSAAGTLGLLRLNDQAIARNTLMARSKYSVDALNAQGVVGARNGKKRGAGYLDFDGRKDWSRPLRSMSKDVLFVSFSVYGSPETIIDVGGARLSVTESTIPGCAQLAALDAAGAWQSTGLNVPFDFHDKKVLALLPVLTVRLDPAADTFDLYQGAQLLAEDLPLQSDKKAHKFALNAGADGAWVMGLVQSDENPHYPDANGNGVDDTFEQSRKGRLLNGNDTKGERKALIAEWRTHQLVRPAPALFVNLPMPDGE